MSLAVFNINDAGVQVAIDGDLIRTSPGYAVLDQGTLMTGEEAGRHAKLLPRWTNNRFWSQLTTANLPNGTAQVRHHADVAFAHLEALWQPIRNDVSGVIFVVPGYYTQENLGLLLGMAREAGIPVTGVVDHSVLVASNLPLRASVLHLDIHLHSVTLTKIRNTGTLARQDVKTILETGLFTLWDRWANIIANQFIQSTRFDPMHDARSEQLLFDLLPQWISRLNDSGMHSFQLALDDTEHTVAVSHESLLKACTPLYPQIVQAIRSEIAPGESASLLVSHRFQGFPGLKQSLALISDLDLVDLNEMKAIGSAHLHSDEIISDTEAISHITQLSTGEITEAMDSGRQTRATHLLWHHEAFAIGSGFKLDADITRGPRHSQGTEAVCTLYPRGEHLIMECSAGSSVRINGNPAETSNELVPGDRVEIGDETLTLIAVSSR